jgi:putative oxidoreductase
VIEVGRTILLAAQLGLAAVFVAAGAGKMLGGDSFVAALRLTHLPPVLVQVLRRCLPPAELALAIALLLTRGTALVVVMLLASGLLAIFALWTTWIVVKGVRVTCGCFGSRDSTVTPRSAIRNGCLAVAALVGGALARGHTTPIAPVSLELVLIVGSAVVVAMLVLALQRVWPALVLTDRDLQELLEREAQV